MRKWTLIILIVFGIALIAGVIMVNQKLSLINLFPKSQKGIVSAQGEVGKGDLGSYGYSGFGIISYKVNDVSFTNKDYSSANFDFSSTIARAERQKYTVGDFVNQEIYINNKLETKQSFNMSILVQINYDRITWNGTEYNLKDYAKERPLILSSWLDKEFNKKIIPNIFFGEENKRINYQDIVEQGGYALAYQDNKLNYIELIIENKQINPFENTKVDPTYANATDGFSLSAIGSGFGAGITTTNISSGKPTDFFITDTDDDFVYHVNKSGYKFTDGFSTSALGSSDPYGITTNGSDFWITDLSTDNFVYHVNRTGGNITDGFSLSTIGSSGSAFGITTNVTSGTPTDFWIAEFADNFTYHTNKSGYNFTDGFKTNAFGSDRPIGIVMNNSDFWITDFSDVFVYHTNKSGFNYTDGFSLSAIGISDIRGGITINVTSGTPTDFWITDVTDDFVYHLTCTNCGPPPIYIINITSPTTLNPLSVNDYDNISINFNFLQDGVNVTSGVEINNVTIGGVFAPIKFTFFSNQYTDFIYEDFDQATSDLANNWDEGSWTAQTSTTYCVDDDDDDCARSTTLDTAMYYATSVDTSNCDSGTLNMSLRMYSLGNDNGETLNMITSIDGGSNYDTQTIQNGNSSNFGKDLYIPLSDGNFSSQFRIGFGTTGTDTGEYYYVDNVRVACLESGSIREFLYIDGIGWQVNVTVPAGLTGLQDLFVNATYSGNTRNDTQTDAIDYGAVEDTEFPVFSDYQDNNGSYAGKGNISLSITVTNTNGTVWVTFNGTNYSASSSGSEFPSEGLVHYWKFNETSGTSALDIRGRELGNELNGTLKGSATFTGDGVLFDTGDNVTVSSYTGEPQGLNNFSIALWMNISGTACPAIGLLWNGLAGTYENSIIMNGAPCAIKDTHFNGYTGADPATLYTNLFNDSKWHLFVFTGNYTGVDIYINNTNNTYRAHTNIHNNISNNVLYFGKTDNYQMKGKIKEIGIWNRTLTPIEIETLWNNADGLFYNSFGRFNVTILNFPSGTYYYNWSSYGNGTDKNYNVSMTRSYTINTSNTCTYGGSGNWRVQIEDNCIISSDVDLSSNVLWINGSSGSFTCQAGIKYKELHITPTVFNGGFQVIRKSGCSMG